ncbi:hypothetical protein [Brevundimonas sp.]|uniref:hypothetical protein n=1 Tax=Brevundimonas sp. TaxID=1871086 RepID=UPI003BAB760F
MNRLPCPVFDDAAALAVLSENRRLASFPSLRDHLATMQTAYAQYVAVNGDVTRVDGVVLPANVEGYLKQHYVRPPQALAFIDPVRLEGDLNSCPMCGSFAGGSLDHMMPQGPYPAFSIYSRNLVPACKCNSRRGTRTRGPAPGQRILHPYFDEVLGRRLLTAKFEDLGIAPKVSLEILLPIAHPDYPAVAFHVETIVKPTQIRSYLTREWAKLMERPGRITTALRLNPQSRHALVKILRDERERADDAGRNNWESVFYSGLLRPFVTDWLFHRFCRPGRLPNAPLI